MPNLKEKSPKRNRFEDSSALEEVTLDKSIFMTTENVFEDSSAIDGKTMEFESAVDLDGIFAQIDPAERREYEQALKEAPDLVEQESPFSEFLWTEYQDSYRAALRLARYWKARKYLFGPDRWLRPLNQTGTGALCDQDVAFLRSGSFVSLVRPSGGVVALMDHSRMPFPLGESMTRVAFYLTYLHAKELRTSYTTIHIESGAPRPPLALSTDAFAIFNVALPVRLNCRQAFVVRACFEPGREALVDYMAYQTRQMVHFNSKFLPGQIMEQSLKDTLRKLQDVSGMEKECLPRCIGGYYDYIYHDEWMRRRLYIESAQVPFPKTKISFQLSCIEKAPKKCKGYVNTSRAPISKAHNNDENKTTASGAAVLDQWNPPQNKPLIPTSKVVIKSSDQDRYTRMNNGLILHWIDYREQNPYLNTF